MLRRRQSETLINRISEPRRTIQVVAGPRQVGKTTMVKQILKNLAIPSMFFNADTVESNQWISERWEDARAQLRYQRANEMLLVIDEIHKIDNWSEAVKREWDADTFNDVNLKVVLLGSSRLLLKKGLTESLAGRFELIPMGHWSYDEMHKEFGWTIEQYIYYGGYPGSAAYINDESRWRRYIRDAIVAPAIEKDVIQTSIIYKPALLHQLFKLSCSYSSELLSYNKMLGSLQDAGNTTTLASYMELLGESKLVTGLQKYAVDASRKYRSIPKLQVYNNALMTAMTDGISFKKAYTQPKLWGRWVESAVGCWLLDHADEMEYRLYYWRDGNDEVDFVVVHGETMVAIEVKSGHEQTDRGLSVLREKYHPKHSLVVGGSSMPLEQLFQGDLRNLF